MKPTFFESLEDRRLMTATYTLVAGTLTVNGSGGADEIHVSASINGKTIFISEALKSGESPKYALKADKINKVVVHGNGGNDKIYMGETFKATWVYGDAGNDQLNGGPGIDYLYGGLGDDQLNGYKGQDFLYGESGDDTFFDDNLGGISADRYTGGSGFDRISYAGRSEGVTVRLDGTATSGRAGEKDVVLSDVEGILGTIYADTLIGNSSKNQIFGSEGSDIINGKGGDDALFGEGGNDILTGGAGKDLMVGGWGNDLFYANDNEGGDSIWGHDYGVTSHFEYDAAFVDDAETNDVTFATDKNYWM